MTLFAALAALVAASLAGRFLLWNLTPSLPRGVYRMDRRALPRRNALVVFLPPASARPVIAARGYLPADAWLLKMIVALPGDEVCIRDVFVVNGQAIGSVARRDSAGRVLEPFRFCGVVARGLAFVATGSRLSFDSRYFGPVPISSLTVVVPLWTY